MTHKFLIQGQKPPRIPEFYTMTKIHNPTPVGHPISFRHWWPYRAYFYCSFVYSLLQLIAIESYIKDTTDFINFIEDTPLPDSAILASLDVCSLYTNIPQDEGINTVCRYYEDHYKSALPSLQQIYGT